MGIVYLARDPSIERQVALKTVRFDGPGGSFKVDEAKARFLKEARISGRLQHPNIVTIFDVGEDAGNLYLAMEFVNGPSLAQRLADPEPLPIEERIRIVVEVAQALGHAHERGVIHRDIKPANILLNENVTAKVTDFGIGKLLTGDTELTSTGQMVGSPAYMSPEQIKGEKLDVRSDIFSLGVVLYQTLTTRKPFPADTLTTLVYQILHEEPPDPCTLRSDLPPEVSKIIRKCLAKNREDRYADATELASDLGTLVGLNPVMSTGSLSESKVSRARRQGAAAIPIISPPTPPRPTPPKPAPPKPAAPPARQTTGDEPTEYVGGMAGMGSDTPTISVRSGPTTRPPLPAPTPEGPKAGASSKKPLLFAVGGVAAVAVLVGAGLALRGGNRPKPTPTAAPTAPPTPSIPIATASTATSPEGSPTPLGEPSPYPTLPPPTAAAVTSPIPTLGPTPAPTKKVAAAPPTPVPPTPTPLPPTPTPRLADKTLTVKRTVKLAITPNQARLFLDGDNFIGIADDWDDNGGGALLTFATEGRHKLRITYPGFKDVMAELNISSSANLDKGDLVVQLEKGAPEGITGPEGKINRPDYRTVGPVRFSVDPSDARLTVNGKDFGAASQWKDEDLRFKDQAVYDISFTAPGFEPRKIRVIVSPSTKEVRAVVKEKLRKERK